jgi:hypothetical protein
MSTFINLAGKRYGRWLVLSKTPSLSSATTWRCQCDCGAIKDYVLYTSLIRGASQSCGCLRKELLAKPDAKVHSPRNPTYRIWMSMKTRCLRSNHPSFKNYGGRGITITDECWLQFDHFLADMGNRPDGASLDRIDNEKGYCKENCKWSSILEQSRNRRNSIKVEWRGETLVLTEVARKENVDYPMLRYRVLKGMDLELAVEFLKSKGKAFVERAAILNGSHKPRLLKPYKRSGTDETKAIERAMKHSKRYELPASFEEQKVKRRGVVFSAKHNAWLRRCMAKCAEKGLTYRGPLPTA